MSAPEFKDSVLDRLQHKVEFYRSREDSEDYWQNVSNGVAEAADALAELDVRDPEDWVSSASATLNKLEVAYRDDNPESDYWHHLANGISDARSTVIRMAREADIAPPYLREENKMHRDPAALPGGEES